MTQIDTQSINLIATDNEGGKSVLYIGLKEAYRDKPQYQRYLKKEYERAKDLDNPNIFKVLSLTDTDNGPVIETEWEDSIILADWLKETHTDDEKKRVVRQVATAISYMHSQGVINGNLNSHNVFITRKGEQVKLLVVRLRYTDILKQPNETLKYLAPEAKDGTVAIDDKADIYSLGIMLKDMGFLMEYAPVISQCTRFGRNERYENIDEFLDALDRRHYTRTNNNPEEISTPANGTTNKKMAVIVAIIVVLVIAAIAILIAQGSGDDEQPAQQQPAKTEQVDSTSQEQQSSDMDSTEKQQPSEAVPSDSTGAAYTGDNAFLNDLVPQMHTDLDKIFNSGADQATINRKVASYYKGLRRVLKNQKGLNSAQLDAFDQAFAEYVKSKKQ